MPAGFPDCPGCHRYLFPALNVDCGFPDCPSLNLLSFAIGFALSSFVPDSWMWLQRYPGWIRGKVEMCSRRARPGGNALPKSIWFGTQGIRRFARGPDCDTKVRNVSRVGTNDRVGQNGLPVLIKGASSR